MTSKFKFQGYPGIILAIFSHYNWFLVHNCPYNMSNLTLPFKFSKVGFFNRKIELKQIMINCKNTLKFLRFPCEKKTKIRCFYTYYDSDLILNKYIPFHISIFSRKMEPNMIPDLRCNQSHDKTSKSYSQKRFFAFKEIIPIFSVIHDFQSISKQEKSSQMGQSSERRWANQQKMMIYCAYSFEFIIINREEDIHMSYINIKALKKLIQGLDYSERLKIMVKKYEVQYNTKLLLEDFQNIVDLASKINNREKTKTKKQEDCKNNPKAESFSHGEFKLFAWTLILYSLAEKLQLPDMKAQHFDDISKIFRNKSIDFIDYQVKCLISSKEKCCRFWEQAELQMLTTIIGDNNTVDWKIISYILFKTSGKKYYRPPHHCREKWVNCINPTIKKGEWTLEEDIEIFQLINLYGCRWALLSRELMGKRSEHAIKNRYNSVVKTMRKQYKITNNQDLEVKVLKYLKFKESKRVCKEQLLNSSNDSKESRERSREVKEVSQSESQKSMEVNANTATLFDDVFDVGMQFKAADTEEIYVKKTETLELSECWLEEKKEKRTWEEDYESINGEISLNGTDNFWTDSLQDQISSEKYSKMSGLYTDQSYRFFGSSAFDSQDIYQNMKEVGAGIQSALGSVHYEKLMNDEWLFNNSWEQ